MIFKKNIEKYKTVKKIIPILIPKIIDIKKVGTRIAINKIAKNKIHILGFINIIFFIFISKFFIKFFKNFDKLS